MTIKFLDVKRAYYADPESVVVEYWNDEIWRVCESEPQWSPGLDYRIRPRTIRIGEIDVPEPVRDESVMKAGMQYWGVCFDYEAAATNYEWEGDNMDIRSLNRGLIHLTKEAAIEHAKALIIVSGGKV